LGATIAPAGGLPAAAAAPVASTPAVGSVAVVDRWNGSRFVETRLVWNGAAYVENISRGA
jgi:hypothetical protein